MRNEFFKLLHERMAQNKDIWFITGDLGYGLADSIRDSFPDRFVNGGAAECAIMDIAVGLALEGKIPFVYSITPFLIYRPFETIRTYINHEGINVKLIGSGRDDDYKHDGFSHDASDIYHFLDGFPHIGKYYPDSKSDIPDMLNSILESKSPSFLSLSR